ncbi:DNA alkylation repair protein [Candidatus Saccharibacteria bacterium]|nr:DNA alkylation repair protein [Candidatus Saccharibacteria bacterium]
MITGLKAELRAHANPEKVAFFPRFFKTGPGEYGEGDKFLGITVPSTRLVAKKYIDLPLKELEELLSSPWHEDRLTALHIMVYRFNKSDDATQKELYEFYIKHTDRINNWDLVDTSARDVVGGYIYHHQELLPKLNQLSQSKILWERRIAVIASSYFIGKGEPDITIRLSEALLHDTEDLIHKAVGWMLREVGKRCGQDVLLKFLDQHAHEMPRTMLRYSIEHLSEPTRQKYLRADLPVL